MGSANDVYIKILAKDGTAKGIDSAERKLSSFGAQATKIGGLIAGAFAVRAIIRFGKESMNLYNVQAQAEQQLLVALKGREDAQQRLIKQAGELQQKTLFGDEETIQAQALIAAFVKEEDQIKRIIPLVQDLAAAKNMSLAGAADLVSKTLGSSTNAMSRYGIEVEGTVGSVERLESLMRSLNDAFGGQAAAAAEVGTGAITQLTNVIGDLKEEMGKLLVTGDGFNTFIRGSTEEIKQWATIIGDADRSGFKKWMLFLGGSKKKWAEVATEINKAAAAQLEVKAAVDAFEKSISETPKLPPPPDPEPIINVGKRIREVNAEMTALQKVIENPSTGYEAAIQAYNDALKLKKELTVLNQIMSFSTPRENVPEKMVSKETPTILAAPATDLFGSDEDMQKALDQSKEKLGKMYEELQTEVDALNQQFNMAMVDGLVGGLEAAISGASFGGVMKALLTPLGQLLEQQGKLMLMSGIGLVALKAGFTNPITGGPALIAAGALLIGAAQGIKALGSAGGGGGGGGYASATASTGSSGYQQTRRGDKQAVDISGKFEIEGDKLVYILDQANAKNSYTNV